jgi:hypothetical protein
MNFLRFKNPKSWLDIAKDKIAEAKKEVIRLKKEIIAYRKAGDKDRVDDLTDEFLAVQQIAEADPKFYAEELAKNAANRLPKENPNWKPGDIAYHAFPDSVEKVKIVSVGTGEYNLKRTPHDPYIVRTKQGQWPTSGDLLFRDPMAAAIKSQALARE